MRHKRKKKRRLPTVPVASMGDIAFLLIIFFLLLSEFSKDKDLALQLPRSGKVEKIEDSVAARVGIDKDGNIYFDGQRVSDENVVASRIEEILKDTVSDDQRHVQFKCDAALGKEVYEPVLQAIAEGGGIIEAVGERQ